MTINFRRALTVCSLVALMTAPSAVAQDPAHLKGKVQKEDTPVRIRRPGMPAAAGAEPADVGTLHTSATKDQLRGIAQDDFMLGFKKTSPVLKKEDGKAAAADKDFDLDDDALVIAWEEWHHRVAAEIFQRWRELGQYPGVAHTTLTFTRAGRVFCTVHDVELPDDVYEVMKPQYRMYSIDEIKNRFRNAIQAAVMPLDGSSAVHFPERSKRDMVTLTPDFSGGVDEGYHWKHDDYERVK